MGVVHGVAEAELRGGKCDEMDVSLRPVDGLCNAEDAPCFFLRLQTSFIQEVNEDLRTAIACGQFRSFHLDPRIIDSISIEGGQKVLHHDDAPLLSSKASTTRRISYEAQFSGNERLFGQVDPLKNQTGIGSGRTNPDSDSFSGKKADAGNNGFLLESFLNFVQIGTGQLIPLFGGGIAISYRKLAQRTI